MRQQDGRKDLYDTPKCCDAQTGLYKDGIGGDAGHDDQHDGHNPFGFAHWFFLHNTATPFFIYSIQKEVYVRTHSSFLFSSVSVVCKAKEGYASFVRIKKGIRENKSERESF